MATQHQSKPSYLGDPTEFCFPTPASYSSSTSTNSGNYVDAGSLPEVHIERVGSVLIKSGYSKVQPFIFECLSSPSSENGSDYLIPVILEPPSKAVAGSASSTSSPTDFSDNASICSVNDIAENKIINSKETGVVEEALSEGNYGSITEKHTPVISRRSEYSEINESALGHKSTDRSTQSSHTNKIDIETILNRTPSSVHHDVTSSVYSSRLNAKPAILVNNTTSRQSSYSVSSLLSDSIMKKNYESKQLPKTALSTRHISTKSSKKGKNKENVSIELPRRSSKRMLIYEKLGVEPNGEALFQYVKSQQSIGSPKTKAKRKSKNLDNLSKMIQELQELQESIESEQYLEGDSGASEENKDFIFDSTSTRAFSSLKKKKSLLSTTSRPVSSPLKERSISQRTKIIEQEVPPMKYCVGPFNEHNSLSRKRTTKLKRSISKLNTVDEQKLKTLPHLPEARKEEVCELKRSPAIKRKNKFIENVIKVIQLIIRAPVKAYRNVSVKSRKLFTFGHVNKGNKKKHQKNRQITISCPTQVNIKDTSFGPEVFSTFGTYSGGSGTRAPLQKRASVGSRRIPSTRTHSDATESDLLSYWTCLLKTSVNTRTELKLDLEKLSKMEHIASLKTNTRRSSVRSQANSEMLLNKYILSDAEVATVSQSDYCSLCGSGFSDEQREEQVCSECEERSMYKPQLSLATLSTSSLGDSSTYGSGSSSISSMEEIYDDYSMISDSEDGHSIRGSSSPDLRCCDAKSEDIQSHTSLESLKRQTIRPSMRFTNLQYILKNNGSVKHRSARLEQDIGAAESWRPKLFGPRPMPDRLNHMITEE